VDMGVATKKEQKKRNKQVVKHLCSKQ